MKFLAVVQKPGLRYTKWFTEKSFSKFSVKARALGWNFMRIKEVK